MGGSQAVYIRDVYDDLYIGHYDTGVVNRLAK